MAMYKQKQRIYSEYSLRVRKLNNKSDALDDWANHLFYTYVRKLKEAKFHNHGITLNIGCGTGNTDTKFLLKLGYLVVGLDISISALKILKDNYRSVNLIDVVCADAENLPFRNNSFDTFLEMNTLHHLPNPTNCIKESIRVANKVFLIDSLKSLITRLITKFGMFAREYGEIPSRLAENEILAALPVDIIMEIHYILAIPHFLLTYNRTTRRILKIISEYINFKLLSSYKLSSQLLGKILGNYGLIILNRDNLN
jgi:SAM-dependent methyltransferase